MSNNHSHDNIYSILGKLDALKPTPEEKRFALVKEIRESVEAQGSILTGVDSVQQRLAEQFAESKIEEKAVSQAQQKFMGMVHAAQKGEKAASPEVAKVAKSMGKKDAKDFAATKHTGLPKHVEEAPAVCAECGMTEGSCEHTMSEGETTRKDGVTKHRKTDFPGYPSDDLDDSEEDENKGKRGRPRKHAKKKDTGEKRGRGRPSKHSTGEKSSKDSLPFSSKNKMGHDPFGRVKPGAEKTVAESMDNLARRLTEGVNFANLLKEKHQTVDEMLAELSNDMKVFKETGHCSELLRDCMEIKGYHGKMVADEGSELAQRPSNPDPFAYVKDAPKPPSNINGIGGIRPPVTKPGQAVKDLTNPFKRTYEEDDSLASELDELAKLAGLSEVSRGEYIKQQDTDAERSGKNKFNAFGQIFNTDEIKEEPNEGNAFTAGLEDDDIKIGDKIPGTNAIKTKDIDTVDEAKVDVKDAPDAVNKPRAKHYNIKSILDSGDDLNKKKQQYADKPKLGDNPMATLESQLAAEYESIKKVS
jgi:hypothetical protein